MKKSNLVISIILSSISIFLIGLVIFFDKQKLSSFLDVFPFILLLIILFFTLYFNNIYKSMQKDLENEKGLSFSGYNNMPGTNWTIASHVSTLCGVPLVMYFQSIGNTKGEKKFLPNLYCVSDWFDEHGYYTYFAQSSYMEFVGTSEFVRLHGSEFVRLHGFKKAE